MGNIGHSQGLTALLRSFEEHPHLTEQAQLTITGTGVAADGARGEIRSARVRMTGMVNDDQLERELHSADIGLVTQRYEGSEFNIPSKLMNFMAYGLPILAAVNPGGEVARIIRDSGAGWVVDSGEPASFPQEIARLIGAGDEVAERGKLARQYAEAHFTQDGFAARFEQTLRSVIEGAGAGRDGAATVTRRG